MTVSEPSRRRAPPDEPRTETVSLGPDRHLAYAEYGSPDGDPVVFLHGTPGSRRLGALFESTARDCGVRLLAPDRPGCGRSSPRPDRSVGDAAEFLVPVLDDADVETAELIAFSGGAPYGLAAAATRPDRIDAVDVVAGATPPGFGDRPPAVTRLLTGTATTAPTVLRGLFRWQAWLAERLDPSFVVGQYTTDDAEAIDDATAEIVAADFLEAFARHRTGAVTEFRHAATDWGVDFEAVDAPVSLWHGERDENVPIDGARRLESALPNARLRALDDADHLRTLLHSVPEILRDRE
ncbi:alpha/beta fold hydrolase [Halorussus marinus]|uniref:alpha/beta fold hydrolase n=1 Tax=Halorussus marinus TaxID=2505976 RepID=UPI00106EE245|nr:alpha/beta hydrolase [Halorussus marinus]